MNWIIGILAAAYLAGAVAVFAMHMQMPATFGLAVLRSLCWPASVIVRDLVPRGRPLPMVENDHG